MTDSDEAPAGAAEQLYALPPGDFTQARNELVRAAKDAGDKPAAAAIGKLRRPSSVAWILNQMVRHHGAQLQQLLALGASLREAQTGLDAAQLRELGRQRQQVVNALARQARALSRELGHPVSDAVGIEVEETLKAALADPAAAAAVSSGQLVRGLDYAGVGEAGVDLTGAVATQLPAATRTPPAAAPAGSPAAGRRPPAPDPEAAAARARAVAEELDRARREAAEGEQAAAVAEQALADLEARAAALADRQRELRAGIAELENRLAEGREELAGYGRQAQRTAAERDRAARHAEVARQAARTAAERVSRLERRP